MAYIFLFISVVIFTSICIPLLKDKSKGIITIAGIFMLVGISSIPAIKSLMGSNTLLSFEGSLVTHEISIVIDSLAAWFILVINFTFITGVIYGSKYMQAYQHQSSKLSLHWINFILTYAALIGVCVLQNFIAFLFAWEIMAISAFLLVIFEGYKQKTLKAGLNYLVQSHIAILFLSIGFIWVYSTTQSLDFKSISQFAADQPAMESLVLMLLFFAGFGIKAGFFPFHTWLPHAHPVAPSHVSGIMSGVLIKIGIYGILRMVFLLDANYLIVGYFILTLSILTGIYGVMLAIVQHDLKKLLAYHSIENIGIIGIGIGLGCIGMGTDNMVLTQLGFVGALLHTLNHSLFKSLLFYSAGNVYQSIHSMHIDAMGGLIKRMPHTALLFLISALAICGLPPFNGFISEFIIYNGLFNGMIDNGFPGLLVFVVGIFGLALIGGLAMLCFTKAFGAVFLGTPRHGFKFIQSENSLQNLLPMYLIVSLIVAIGIVPQFFVRALSVPVSQLSRNFSGSGLQNINNSFELAGNIGLYAMAFILLSAIIYFIRNKLSGQYPKTVDETWGCGYGGQTGKMQYTASSFVRNYRKLAEPIIHFNKYQRPVEGIFPGKASHLTHANDKTELYLINLPLRKLRHFLGLFSFIQNGRLQMYILYGMLFITLLIGIPFVVHLLRLLSNFINTF